MESLGHFWESYGVDVVLIAIPHSLPKLRRSAGRLSQPEVGGTRYVYFLESTNGDIYVGSSGHLRRRFASHQNRQVASARLYPVSASPTLVCRHKRQAECASPRTLLQVRLGQGIRKEMIARNGMKPRATKLRIVGHGQRTADSALHRARAAAAIDGDLQRP
jgi:hypothetical protein